MWDAPAKNHSQLHISLGSLYRWKTHGGFSFSDLLIYFPTRLLWPPEQLEMCPLGVHAGEKKQGKRGGIFFGVPPACHKPESAPTP